MKKKIKIKNLFVNGKKKIFTDINLHNASVLSNFCGS